MFDNGWDENEIEARSGTRNGRPGIRRFPRNCCDNLAPLSPSSPSLSLANKLIFINSPSTVIFNPDPRDRVQLPRWYFSTPHRQRRFKTWSEHINKKRCNIPAYPSLILKRNASKELEQEILFYFHDSWENWGKRHFKSLLFLLSYFLALRNLGILRIFYLHAVL